MIITKILSLPDVNSTLQKYLHPASPTTDDNDAILNVNWKQKNECSVELKVSKGLHFGDTERTQNS